MPSAPLRLRCEFVSDPIGVTADQPRLSWWVSDTRPAELQSAYQIIASSRITLLDDDVGDLWDSGRVASNLSAHVPYEGSALQSQQRVWWKVRTFDSDGLESPWSDAAYFEAGMLHAEDWKAHWIATPLTGSMSRGVQVAALRRDFLLTKDIASARLYVASLGVSKIEINGRLVPGSDAAAVWSDYDHQVLYQSYDVTAMLIREPNAIGVLLADGYYSGELPGFGRTHYDKRPKLKLHLDVTFTDGGGWTLGTDPQWHWAPSWILSSELHGGEHIDATQYIDHWSEAGLDERRWSPVEVIPEELTVVGDPHQPRRQLASQRYAGFHVQQVLRPVELPAKRIRQGKVVLRYDFGDQILGRLNVGLHSSSSDNLCIKYCLDDLFETYTEDSFTSRGGAGNDSFAGAFSLHHFRYVEIEVTQGVTKLGEITAARYGLPQQAGLSLRCDHPTLNELFEVIDNSLKAVSLSVPMRGVLPHQQIPDSAYASTWVRYAARHSRAHALILKWLDDLLVASEHPHYSSLVPDVRRAAQQYPADEVALFESMVAAAWALYRHQGDTQVLERCYGHIRTATLSYRHLNQDLLRQPVDVTLYGESQSAALVATASTYGALCTVSRLAGVLGHLGDRELIESLAKDVRRAFRRRFLTQDGHLAVPTQSALVAALYHKLLNEQEQPLAEKALVSAVVDNHYHANVAPVILHGLLPALTQAKRLDVAYMVLVQTSEPSWFSAIQNGARHVGQHLDQPDIAGVGLLEWLMDAMVGLSLHEDFSPERNGYKTVRVRPMPPLGQQFMAGAPVQFVEAALETMHGRYEVKWWIHADHFELEMVVPPGCNALVTMPDNIEQAVQSGHHRFVMDFEAGRDGVPTLLDNAAPGA